MAKYPDIIVVADPSDTALTLLKKAQEAFYKARASGMAFTDHPRDVAMKLFGLDLETLPKKTQTQYKASGIPRSVYSAVSTAQMKTNLALWVTVQEAA